MLAKNEEWAIHCVDGELITEVRVRHSIKAKRISIDQLLSLFQITQQDSGWLPSDVRRFGISGGKPWFLAYFPPGVHRARFLTRRSEKLFLPGMVLVGHGDEYRIFMRCDLESGFRKDMPLIPAPFPNVHPDAKVCWGQNKALEGDVRNAAAMWALFWTAPFNGDLGVGNRALIQAMRGDAATGKGSATLRRELAKVHQKRLAKFTPALIVAGFAKHDEDKEEEDTDETDD